MPRPAKLALAWICEIDHEAPPTHFHEHFKAHDIYYSDRNVDVVEVIIQFGRWVVHIYWVPKGSLYRFRRRWIIFFRVGYQWLITPRHRWVISFKPTREHEKLVFTAVASYKSEFRIEIQNLIRMTIKGKWIHCRRYNIFYMKLIPFYARPLLISESGWPTYSPTQAGHLICRKYQTLNSMFLLRK